MAASKPCAAGGPARGHGAGFSPRQPPKFCRNIRNSCRKPCGTRRRAFRIIRNTSETPAKRAGDYVAQREFIRIAPATPEAITALESCGVADQTTIFGAAPGTGNWTSPRAAPPPHLLHIENVFAECIVPGSRYLLTYCRRSGDRA
jgi:hypothetical protein